MEVPIEELLVEPRESFSAPVLKRTHLIKLMKMAVTISKVAESDSVRQMAEMMVELLIEIMPNLEEMKTTLGSIGPSSRGRVGRIAEAPLPAPLFESFS